MVEDWVRKHTKYLLKKQKQLLISIAGFGNGNYVIWKATEDDFFVNIFLSQAGLHALKRFQENIDGIVITPAKSFLLNYLPFSNQSKKTECASILVSLVWQLGTVSELQHREDGLSNHVFAALKLIFRSMRAVQILRALHKSDIIIFARNK